MEDLATEFKFNASMVTKIQEMEEHYAGYRPIRGDGNCYYRAVGFSFVERCVLAVCDGTAAAASEAQREKRAQAEGLLKGFCDKVAAADFAGNAEAEAARTYVLKILTDFVETGTFRWRTAGAGDDKNKEKTCEAMRRKFDFQLNLNLARTALKPYSRSEQ